MKQSKQLVIACAVAMILVVVVFVGAQLHSGISARQPSHNIVQTPSNINKCSNWQRTSLSDKQDAEGALNSVIAISPNNLALRRSKVENFGCVSEI